MFNEINTYNIFWIYDTDWYIRLIQGSAQSTAQEIHWDIQVDVC